MRKAVFIALAMALLLPSLGMADDKQKLPAGRYIYLGSDANNAQPEAFNVRADGTVIWQSAAATKSQSSAIPLAHGDDAHQQLDIVFDGKSLRGEKTSEESSTGRDLTVHEHQNEHKVVSKTDPIARTDPTMEHIESMDWPIIKFRPKQIPGSKGFAQLTTTMDVTAISTYGLSIPNRAKYKLIFLRAAPVQLTVQLLDANGFKVRDFRVMPKDFEPIPDSELIAARGEFQINMNDYQTARDFSLVIQPTETLNSLRFPNDQYR